MSVEDLMRPRYKVTGDYPNSPYQKGDILYKEYSLDDFPIAQFVFTDKLNVEYVQQITYPFDKFCTDFPVLFRLMEWWEEREESDMPEYVKRESGKIFQIDTPTKGMLNHHGIAYLTDRDTNGLKNFIHLHSTLPATKEEFLAHQNKKQ